MGMKINNECVKFLFATLAENNTLLNLKLILTDAAVIKDLADALQTNTALNSINKITIIYNKYKHQNEAIDNGRI